MKFYIREQYPKNWITPEKPETPNVPLSVNWEEDLKTLINGFHPGEYWVNINSLEDLLKIKRNMFINMCDRLLTITLTDDNDLD
jgi:hypothetical protein